MQFGSDNQSCSTPGPCQPLADLRCDPRPPSQSTPSPSLRNGRPCGRFIQTFASRQVRRRRLSSARWLPLRPGFPRETSCEAELPLACEYGSVLYTTSAKQSTHLFLSHSHVSFHSLKPHRRTWPAHHHLHVQKVHTSPLTAPIAPSCQATFCDAKVCVHPLFAALLRTHYSTLLPTLV
ncbi:hypothetical protein VTK26DRAFT_8465 [Humicola hyalothermophila]